VRHCKNHCLIGEDFVGDEIRKTSQQQALNLPWTGDGFQATEPRGIIFDAFEPGFVFIEK
jgi:hypothetical protein